MRATGDEATASDEAHNGRGRVAWLSTGCTGAGGGTTVHCDTMMESAGWGGAWGRRRCVGQAQVRKGSTAKGWLCRAALTP